MKSLLLMASLVSAGCRQAVQVDDSLVAFYLEVYPDCKPSYIQKHISDSDFDTTMRTLRYRKVEEKNPGLSGGVAVHHQSEPGEHSPKPAVTCEVCYEEKETGEMLASCKNGHQFCVDCNKAFMKIGIGERKSDLNCCLMDKCEEKFSDRETKRCLGPNDYKEYEKIDQEQCIMKARENGHLEGYEECPEVSFVF
jgi:hypothetical protein